jgi:hypothetical protein
VKLGATGSRAEFAKRLRIAGLLGDLTAGGISALVMLCYAMSLGTLIFSADLAHYVELDVPTAFVSCIVTEGPLRARVCVQTLRRAGCGLGPRASLCSRTRSQPRFIAGISFTSASIA